MDQRLMLLRVQLFTAMQVLKGDDLREFWELIDQINDSRLLNPPPAAADTAGK